MSKTLMLRLSAKHSSVKLVTALTEGTEPAFWVFKLTDSVWQMDGIPSGF
jgi:hypothetical protein